MMSTEVLLCDFVCLDIHGTSFLPSLSFLHVSPFTLSPLILPPTPHHPISLYLPWFPLLIYLQGLLQLVLTCSFFCYASFMSLNIPNSKTFSHI